HGLRDDEPHRYDRRGPADVQPRRDDGAVLRVRRDGLRPGAYARYSEPGRVYPEIAAGRDRVHHRRLREYGYARAERLCGGVSDLRRPVGWPGDGAYRGLADGYLQLLRRDRDYRGARHYRHGGVRAAGCRAGVLRRVQRGTLPRRDVDHGVRQDRAGAADLLARAGGHLPEGHGADDRIWYAADRLDAGRVTWTSRLAFRQASWRSCRKS